MLKEITFSLHVGPVAGGSKLHAPARLLARTHPSVYLCTSLDVSVYTTRTKSTEEWCANSGSVLFFHTTEYCCVSLF